MAEENNHQTPEEKNAAGSSGKADAAAEAPSQQTLRQQAREAMEGAERVARREAEAKAKTLNEETTHLEQRLGEIAGEKEKLELAWLDLDNARRVIHQRLNLIVAEEKRIEEEETALESEEGRIGVGTERQGVEKKRWGAQEHRRQVEEKRWQEENQLTQIEKTIGENTQKYRVLLEEEDKQQAELEKLKTEALIHASP